MAAMPSQVENQRVGVIAPAVMIVIQYDVDTGMPIAMRVTQATAGSVSGVDGTQRSSCRRTNDCGPAVNHRDHARVC